MTPDDVAARILDNVVAGPNNCLIWTKAKSHGYGTISVDGKTELAHRVAYTVLVGPIPEGLHLDHVYERGCRFKSCVNPAHLEPVTPGENSRRHTELTTECPKGHPYDDENTQWNNGKRTCKRCEREATKARRGPRPPRNKLNAEQVAELRALAGTASQRQLADRFGISQSQVGRILLGERWQS